MPPVVGRVSDFDGSLPAPAFEVRSIGGLAAYRVLHD